MNFVSNIIWNSVEGFVEAGTRSAGGYAGDALIKAGDMIENYGRGVGTSVERAVGGYGSKISGQTYTPSAPSYPTSTPKKAITSTSSKRPATKRSNSVATSKPSQLKTPIGTAKTPGTKTVGAATGAVTGAGIAAGVGATSLGKSIGGDAERKAGNKRKAKKRGAEVKKELPKPFPNNMTYPTAKVANTTKPNSTISKAKDKKDNSTKPYPGTTIYPGTDKKTAIKPGQKAKSIAGEPESKPYPGTTTYPGSEKKTPVKATKYKPLERHKPPVEKGKVQHIAVGS